MTALNLAVADTVMAGTKAERSRLANGMEVVVIPDHRAPVVTHMVWYRVGAADEPRGVSGIAHFLEHLMFKGTNKIASGEFSKIIARNGGEDNAFTSQDITAYYQRVAKEKLAMVMEMEADRMRNLRLAEDDVLTERDVILEERRSRTDNDPSAILREQMDAALYLSHPYGTPVIGWEHEMRELSRQDALDFYKRFYAPNNAILVVAGDVTMQKVLELAKETYAKIEPVADVKAGKRPSEPPHMAARRIEIKDPRAGQANVRRDYYVPSYTTAGPGEAEALELLMKVLASGATGRVYKQLVIDGKLASSAGGWYSSYGKDSGELSFYAIAADGVSIDRVEAALSNVIADVVKNGVSEDELQRAKNALIADHVYDADSQNKLAQRYGWGLTIGQTIADIEEWPQRLEAVSLDAVNAVAKKHLRLKNSVTGILLPEQPEE